MASIWDTIIAVTDDALDLVVKYTDVTNDDSEPTPEDGANPEAVPDTVQTVSGGGSMINIGGMQIPLWLLILIAVVLLVLVIVLIKF